jgi:putative FmdB family regulatory protein
VATYAYRCGTCGLFDVDRPMGSAPPAVPCPACDAGAPRVYTPPLLAWTPSPLARARAAEERSADYPKVTDRVPPRRGRASPPGDPRWKHLPKW